MTTNKIKDELLRYEELASELSEEYFEIMYVVEDCGKYSVVSAYDYITKGNKKAIVSKFLDGKMVY